MRVRVVWLMCGLVAAVTAITYWRLPAGATYHFDDTGPSGAASRLISYLNFPVALIVWVIYAIAYQQVENYVIQPQIQRRAVAVEPFVVLVAVLFGSTLFGIIGALLAIPAAASIQIAIREWMAYRREVVVGPDDSAAAGSSRGAEAPT